MNIIDFKDLKKATKDGAKNHDIWLFNPKGVIGVFRVGLIDLLTSHEFYKKKLRNGSYLFYRRIEFTIKEYSAIEVREFVFDFFFVKQNAEYQLLIDSVIIPVTTDQLKEVLIRNQDSVFNNSFLTGLTELPYEIARDNNKVAYVPFLNLVVKIDANTIEYLKYSDFDNKVFYSNQIIQHEFSYSTEWKSSMFADYIKNITNNEQLRKNSIRSAIGYLIHRYNDVSNAQAVILYDEVMSGKNVPEGGTGKGLFAQAISKVIKGYVPLDGKSIKLDSQFVFQKLKEGTDVVFIDDVSISFDIDGLNSVLSEGINIEKKFRDVIELPKEETPKFIISSNHILANEGSTRERRQYIIQFSSFYKDKYREGNIKPIIAVHGARFFSDDWDISEWNRFYSFMLNCLKYYLNTGLVTPPLLNFKKNAFIHKHGIELYCFLKDIDFNLNKEFNTKELYVQFIGDDDNPVIKQRGFTNALTTYLKDENIEYNLRKQVITISKKD